MELAIPTPANAVHPDPDPSSFAGQEHPREQQLQPTDEWAKNGTRTRPQGKEKVLPEET